MLAEMFIQLGTLLFFTSHYPSLPRYTVFQDDPRAQRRMNEAVVKPTWPPRVSVSVNIPSCISINSTNMPIPLSYNTGHWMESFTAVLNME